MKLSRAVFTPRDVYSTGAPRRDVNGAKGMSPFGKLLDDEQVAGVVRVSPADVRSARP